MTEDEAKTKWCPFARVVSADQEGPFSAGLTMSGGAPVHNRVANGPHTTVPVGPCLASGCMAWRRYPERLAPGPFASDDSVSIPGGGYCGLAGPA